MSKQQIEYSTVAKLIKNGKLNKGDLLGNKLKSEIAKELYKNNIRVHSKHYIPKDLKKYYYEEEITGGKINLIKSFKKIGSTVKHDLQKALGQVENFTQNTVEGVQNYANTVLHGRNDYPPNVRELINKYGELTIKSIIIDRTPVPSILTSALNAVSLGKFSKRMNVLPYDKLFHLRMDITFENNKKLTVEKNEVINMYTNSKIIKGSEQLNVPNITQNLTLNQLLEGAKRVQGNKFFKYSASSNNCQDFILSLLKGSNIGNEETYNFVKQNTEHLFKGDSFLRKFSNTVTDIGSKVNEITQGTGLKNNEEIQSIVFKNKVNNTNIQNKMAKVKYCESDSDSSSSDSEHETPRSGIFEEKEILKKIKMLRKEIKSHHKMHGGKINIAKSFKKLGNTIKRGFERKIIPVANEVGHYITDKKGGLATDIIKYGIPAASSAVLGGLATVATGGNPVAGVAASALGAKLGTMGAAKLRKTTGTGMNNLELEMDGEGLKRRRRINSIDQLIDTHRNREYKEFQDALRIMATDINREKHPPKIPKYSKALGSGFKKGSIEAKEHMAKIRAMKKN